ncbi:MAG: phosphoadenylyl-sulfate reductase [Cytophagales bacterium]|nr:MAG: phosphoadenylyl-sulfate reductase [Cytophagales bacterium]TAF62318.1 MAG: phosphoadenylyl-sulfate reductase [Cytophagales bacterium]
MSAPTPENQELIHSLELLLSNSDLQADMEALNQLAIDQKLNICFSTSFGVEDQILTDAIKAANAQQIRLFTLDTGRLFPETYNLWARTVKRYGIDIQAYYPSQEQVESYVTEYGINAFYESVPLRKACCHIRKVEPLKRALANAHIWISGLRAEQSSNRQTVNKVEWDSSFQVIKCQPLLSWTAQQVWDYVHLNNVSYNTLHDSSFPSIGCAPCTRAVREGEDFRSGRWWWEDNSQKECGLHRS